MHPQASRETRFDGIHCSLVIQQPASGVLLLKISGTDIGEFGDAPMLALDARLSGHSSMRLFIDAREVRGASIEVSGEWSRWLSAHKQQLQQVSMLTGSRFVEVTAEFVRRFSDLEGVMRIYTDTTAFDTALAESLGNG